jgi:hypothetical protein
MNSPNNFPAAVSKVMRLCVLVAHRRELDQIISGYGGYVLGSSDTESKEDKRSTSVH